MTDQYLLPSLLSMTTRSLYKHIVLGLFALATIIALGSLGFSLGDATAHPGMPVF